MVRVYRETGVSAGMDSCRGNIERKESNGNVLHRASRLDSMHGLCILTVVKSVTAHKQYVN